MRGSETKPLSDTFGMIRPTPKRHMKGRRERPKSLAPFAASFEPVQDAGTEAEIFNEWRAAVQATPTLPAPADMLWLMLA